MPKALDPPRPRADELLARHSRKGGMQRSGALCGRELQLIGVEVPGMGNGVRHGVSAYY
jgi:hypothetical protein